MPRQLQALKLRSCRRRAAHEQPVHVALAPELLADGSLQLLPQFRAQAGKRGGTMIFTEQVTEFRDPSGRLVAELRSTMIETSKATTED